MNYAVKSLIAIGSILAIAAIIVACLYERTEPESIRFLLKTSDDRIQLYDSKTNSTEDVLVDQTRGISVFAPLNESIYYASRNPNEIVYSSSINYDDLPSYSKKWAKTALAVDHLTGKVYVMDGATGKVYLVDIYKNYHREILSELDEPKDIAVDLFSSFIFILQSSSIIRAKAESAFHKDTIVEHPNLQAFTIRPSDNILYYSDGKMVVSYDYWSGRKLASYDLANVVSLISINNYLVFIEKAPNSTITALKSCNMDEKTWKNGNCELEELFTNSTLEEVKHYEAPLGRHSLCDIKDRCNQMCINTGGDCVCTEGWSMSNEKTPRPVCVPKDKLFVNIDNAQIAEYQHELQILSEPMLNSTWEIQSFQPYEYGGFIYATDDPSEPIFSTDGFHKFSISTAEWVVTGLALVDEDITDVVYVADEVHGLIRIAKTRDSNWNEHFQILMSGLDRPRNVIVDSQLGLMFVLQATSVLKANMDGTHPKVVFKHADILAITLDLRKKNLYVAVSNVIVSINYLSNKRYLVTELLDNARVISLAVVSGELYAIIERQFVKRSIEQCHLVNAKTCEFKLVYRNDALVDIKSKFDYEERLKTEKFVCSKHNGGCAHFCLLRSDSERYSCACSNGTKLNHDKKTCSTS